MTNYYCNICDKLIKIKSKKKHLNSQYHKSLGMIIISRYIITNLDFPHIEDILKKYIRDYDTKIAFYLFICKFE